VNHPQCSVFAWRIPRERQDDSKDGFLQAGVPAALVHERREPRCLVSVLEGSRLAPATDHNRGKLQVAVRFERHATTCSCSAMSGKVVP
jgi:hypothetical protein